MINVMCICGARPNFMKVAPLAQAFAANGGIRSSIIHTGQHYDEKMSDLFFKQLAIPTPDVNLEVGSGTHAQQTAEIMKRFEPVVVKRHPDFVLVVGDVNSTIACTLVAAKLGIRTVHVEAGLRSFDRTMPEEVNRILTDSISDLLMVSEPSGVTNLSREGVPPSRVHLVGNVMIDTLLKNKAQANESDILEQLNIEAKHFSVLTLHRPSNVDDVESMSRILDALEQIAVRMPIIFPVHPRTRMNLSKLGLEPRIDQNPRLRLIEPLGYLQFLKLMSESAMVLTDSGGMQEETTILRVPCLTLRDNTERPITVEQGTNILVGTDPGRIVEEAEKIVADGGKCGNVPDLWDGSAAQRITEVISRCG